MSVNEIFRIYDKIRSEKKQEIPQSRLKIGERWKQRYSTEMDSELANSKSSIPKRGYKRSETSVKTSVKNN